MRSDCIFLEEKGTGGYCRARDFYVGLTTCEDCESYDNGEEEGGEK